ncbi:MAG: nucleotide-diphospho-sugar transferase, partial [Acidimicrobiales bacterium]
RHSGSRVAQLRAGYEDAHIRLSPYTILARELSESAGLDANVFGAPTVVERILLTSGRRWPQLPELPLAVFDSLVRRVRARLALGRYRLG